MSPHKKDIKAASASSSPKPEAHDKISDEKLTELIDHIHEDMHILASDKSRSVKQSALQVDYETLLRHATKARFLNRVHASAAPEAEEAAHPAKPYMTEGLAFLMLYKPKSSPQTINLFEQYQKLHERLIDFKKVDEPVLSSKAPDHSSSSGAAM